MTNEEMYSRLETYIAIHITELRVPSPLVIPSNVMARYMVDSLRSLDKLISGRNEFMDKPTFSGSGMNKTKEERNSDR